MKTQMGKFLSLAAAILLANAPQAYAATTDTIVTGTQGNAIQTCLQALTNAVGEGEDCGYGPAANNQGPPFGEIIGPLTQGAFYSDNDPALPFTFTNGNGVPTDGATGYIRTVGDGKIEPVINGTITIDDNGTSGAPGDEDDDLISFDLTWTDPLGGKIIRNLGSAVVERYTSMNQVLTAWPVDSATANGAGGFDYVIGSRGFPGRIQFLDGDGAGGEDDLTACDGQLFGSVECSPGFGAGVVNAQKWNPAAGANWVAHPAAAGLGTLEDNHGAQTTGTVADIECVDASDGPNNPAVATDDVDQTGSAAAASDCDDSKIAFSAALIGDCVNFPDAPAATTGCVQIAMDVAFDNMLLKVSTNAAGTVTSAEGFDVQETIVFGATDECGDMTHNATGSGPGGLGGPGLQPFCNTWLSGYFTLASSNVAGDAVDDDAGTVNLGDTKNIDVLANDTDFTDPITVTVTTDPANGTAVVQGDNTITYTPTGVTGADSFVYTVLDNDGETDTATVTITVVDPNVPLAVDDGPAQGAVTFGTDPVTIDVLANDAGLGDTPLTVTATDPAGGSVMVNGSPGNANAIDITYTPDSGFSGDDTFDYTVTDNSGDSSTATVTVTVTADDPVTASDDNATTDEETDAIIDVLANDDANNTPVTVAITTDPTNGTATVNADNTVTYTPDDAFDGSDSFEYSVTDNDGDMDSATVNVTVDNTIVPDASDDDAETDEGEAVDIDVTANDDLGNEPTAVEITSDPSNGSAVVNANDTVTYTPDSEFSGDDSFDYTLTDDNGDTDTATVTITVNESGGIVIGLPGGTSAMDPWSLLLLAGVPLLVRRRRHP